MDMKDLAKLFKAFVCPYLACAFGSTICFHWVVGQDIPQLLWVLFAGALSEIGIEVGWFKLIKKGGKVV